MTDQQKLYRVFRLIQLLSQPPYRKVSHLATILGVDSRTVYRYIKLLESLGYHIDKKEGDRYYLFLDFQEDKQLINLDEAGYLHDLLWQAPAGDPRREHLLHKLNKQYTLAPVAQSLPKLSTYEHVRTLGKAMEAGLRVRLLNYFAPSSGGGLSNRYLEPVEFMQGYTYLWAYDLDKKDYRQFKLDRIGDVEVLDEPIANQHEGRVLDLFGWTGPQWLPVRLRLSSYAHNLLLEEHPDVRPFVRTFKGQALFEGMVRDWRGIGRFILGLPGEVEVVDPEELKAYLRKRAGEGRW
ncbi:MAG: transcriptional regulator [Phaeodactylibacter sp.]|nr:transcriptional regulator [Phaeodactylibacter sp.]MCB9276630.1 transcriptional regulator [Lewinellaceae bacterium]